MKNIVLNSRIPAGGRPLTSAEARALRAAGVTIPGRATVERTRGCDYLGEIYRLIGNVRRASTGILVEVR